MARPLEEKSTMSNAGKRGVVEIRALDAAGNVVEHLNLALEEYYEGLHQLIDQDTYRARGGLVAIEGRVYSSAGKLEQEYRNRYSPTGAYLGGRTVHADGTVNED
jgi:hypothetical protein